MKILVLILMFIPALAAAAPESAPAAASTPRPKCRFSKKIAEQNVIKVLGCSEKLCNHVVICGKIAKSVTCKAKAGKCDDYDANECAANPLTEPAQFETQASTQRPEPPTR